MRQINTRAIKRQCFVPGCRNLQTYMVYRTVEPWAKVVICEDCARELYKSLIPDEVQKVEETPENVPDEVQIVPNIEVKEEQKPVKVTEKKTTTRKSAAK